MSKGLVLSWRHLKDALVKKKRPPIGPESKDYFKYDKGIMTLEYPREMMPVPDNGRYRLHNEIDDCIVCDKCAKVCPVNCIDIEAVKSPSEIRKAADGSSVRLYPAKFDIDMAKCCFCGLCTTVCPTECLTMTKTFDFSEFDVANMNYEFSEMTRQEVDQKKEEFEKYQEEKKKKSLEAKGDKPAVTAKPKVIVPGAKSAGGASPKPVMGKPKIPVIKPKVASAEGDVKPKPKPIIKPKIGAKPKDGEEKTSKPSLKPVIKPKSEDGASKPALKPVIKKPSLKPVIKPKAKTTDEVQENDETIKPKPALKPVIKPKAAKTEEGEGAKAKPVLKPVIKAPAKKTGENAEAKSEPKPALKPVIKPKAKSEGESAEPKKKPALRPVIKPKPKKDEE